MFRLMPKAVTLNNLPQRCLWCAVNVWDRLTLSSLKLHLFDRLLTHPVKVGEDALERAILLFL